MTATGRNEKSAVRAHGISLLASAGGHWVGGNIVRQSFFISAAVRPLASASSSSLVEMAKTRLPIIGLFTLGVGVVHKSHETRTAACRRPLQHLQVTVGVAEGKDRAAVDEVVDPDWLARPIVDELAIPPPPESRIAGSARLMARNTPSRFIAVWRRKSASHMSTSG